MKKMTKAMLMTALILGSVQWGGTPVHASELDTFTLDEYVVTAARTETKLVDTPANITIVGAEEIESRHYQDVMEVLKDVPGANVLDSGYGATTKRIVLNADDRVLVMVDGRRLNSDMGISGRSTYDLNQLPDVSMIERIEVLKGAGGALYGSDAVGGVVNVITKKSGKNYGKVAVAYGSGNTQNMSAMYSFKKGSTGVIVSASKDKRDYAKYRDYATDSTKRWPGGSEFEEDKVSLKLVQELGNDSNLTVGYEYSKYEGISPYTIGYTTSNKFVDRKTENMFLKYDWTVNEKDIGYLQYYRNEMDAYNGGSFGDTTDGIDIQQEVTISDNNKMVVGASWRESNAVNIDYFYDKTIRNIAFFINDAWEFAPTWSLNTGVRYDDYSGVGEETTLSAGLNKKFNDDSHAYITWGQVFKAPTTDDLYYPGSGNPNLIPETGDTWTVGYNTKIAKKTGVGINYFESDLDDAINWADDGTGTWRPSNVDKQKKKGLELTLNHELNDNLDLEASYTYVQAKNNGIKDVAYMPNVYRLGLRYNYNAWDANLFLRSGNGLSASKYVDNSFITVDLAVTYKATDNLKIFAKGYNLFNEAYADYSGIAYTSDGATYNCPAQSRRFLIGAEYSF